MEKVGERYGERNWNLIMKHGRQGDFNNYFRSFQKKVKAKVLVILIGSRIYICFL